MACTSRQYLFLTARSYVLWMQSLVRPQILMIMGFCTKFMRYMDILDRLRVCRPRKLAGAPVQSWPPSQTVFRGGHFFPLCSGEGHIQAA